MKVFFAGFFALMILALPAKAAPDFPALTGRVVDGANILSPATLQALDAKLAGLEKSNSRQLVVVTLPSLGGYEISDYGYQLLRHWGIGQKQINNGAILIVAPNERRVRVEVGYGLEPILTDAFSSVLINTRITPRFKQKDFDGGVTQGVDALVEQMALETSEAEKRAAGAAQRMRQGGERDDANGFAAVVMILFVLFFLFGRKTSLWPLLFLVASSGRGGGYYGGGGRGGWGGGGGGSGGGGGASGGW